MPVTSPRPSARRRLLLASDRRDRSDDLGTILERVGDVGRVTTSDIPEKPEGEISGIVVDINLRSAESVLRVRRKLTSKAYETMPRLFVLADALHHASMQAWALGATDTIERPLEEGAILQRVRAAFPAGEDVEDSAASRALDSGIAAAHAVLVRIFEKLPAGIPLSFGDVVRAERRIVRALRRSSLREWLAAVGRHHNHSYRHCLFVTGFAVAFAQHLGMRDEDQRRLARAALLHDVGNAFIPVAILDKPGQLTDAEMEEIREHPRLGYDALAKQGGYPPEMLDVVLHHHEMLDGSGYPDGLDGRGISDIVRLITIADIHAALVEQRAYRMPFTHAQAFATMENMGAKLDQPLLQAFRPVALGL